MSQGTIKKLVSDRGFGFISGDEGEVFFHMSTVTGVTFESLHEGQRVEYSTSMGPKGRKAETVKPV